MGASWRTVVTRCGQLDSLLQERRETLCSLEADHDQVGSVVSGGVEGTGAVDRCKRSLGGVKAPEPPVVARFPSVSVPVCVFTSVAKCVLKRAHSVGERRCVKETVCVSEMACLSERPCVTETACV